MGGYYFRHRKQMKHLFLILTLFLLASCNTASRKTAADEKPVIIVTIEPLRYFTEAIAGDRFTVVSMVPKGSSPETYDPTPEQLMKLAGSKAYLRIGHIGFEQVWLDRLSSNAPHLPFYDMSRGIDLIFDESHAHHHGPAGDIDEEETEIADTTDESAPMPGVEPHVWNSAANAQIIAANIMRTLCNIDKQGEDLYLQRYDSLRRRIDRVDSLCRQTLDSPEADHAFMIYHPALSYFARDYGLHQLPIEADGKEPSPAHLKELISEARQEKVEVVFVQPEFDRRNAELVAKQVGARVVDINPLAYDWEAEMLAVANALAGK